jgi:hypothetical protein
MKKIDFDWMKVLKDDNRVKKGAKRLDKAVSKMRREAARRPEVSATAEP